MKIFYFYNHLKNIILNIVALLLVHFGVSQNPVSRNINTTNGLPSNTVYNILQDKQGFIWVGHDKGLSRYDGNEFIHYTAPAQQGKSISNLLEVGNSIWCQDFSGNFYNTINDKLIKDTTFTSKGIYTSAGIMNTNMLTVLNYDSIRNYNIATKNINKLSLTADRKPAVLYTNSKIFFFANNTLKSFDGKTIVNEKIFNTTIPNFFYLINIGNIFYGFTLNSFPVVYKISNSTIEPLPVLMPNLVVQDVCVLNNEIWVCTSTGAYCFDKFFKPLYNGHPFFVENSISKVIKDRENNYWFSTIDKGLLLVPDINTKIYRYGNEAITALSTYNNDNEILAGTSSNLVFAFNNKTEKINTLISSNTKGEIVSLYYDKLYKNIITCTNIINVYNNNNQATKIEIAAKKIVPINNDTYIAAYAGGIMLFPRKGSTINIPAYLNFAEVINKNNYNIIKNYRGRTVLYDSTNQTLYTATAAGLQYFSVAGNGFIMNGNKHIYASSLALVQRSLFAATFTDGLFKINNNKATSLNSKNSAILNNINKIVAYQTDLWYTGDELVQHLNLANDSVTNYSAADGIPNAEIKDILVQSSTVYIATAEGLVVFNKNKNSLNALQPTLVINKVLVNQLEYKAAQYANLQSDENNIEIYFSLIAYKGQANSTVQYKINNGAWQKLPKNSTNLQLASLAPGNYTILINGFNEDGIAIEKPIEILIKIAAPFYKKPIFIILVAALLLLGLYFYFQQKLRREKKSNDLLAQKIKLEQELQQSMLASIKSQMNPHFLFNALNTVQSYIYTNDKENASQYLGKFSELTRMILTMSNKEKVSLAEELKALQLYLDLEYLRFEDKLIYTITVADTISNETIYIPSMLIQPYVENAIKHGLMHQKNKWLLQLNFMQLHNSIIVTIDDNGVGRKASEAINQQRYKSHTSFATEANQKRLTILNKGLQQTIALLITDKIDEFGYAQGTTVTLTIPIV